MVEGYLAFFQELEEEVKTFHREGLAAGEMVRKSRAIRFFSHEEGEGLSWAWREEQYRLVAGKILSESQEGKSGSWT